jgi:hypothetical protein
MEDQLNETLLSVKAGLGLPHSTSTATRKAMINDLHQQGAASNKKLLRTEAENLILRDNTCPTISERQHIPKDLEDVLLHSNLQARGIVSSAHFSESLSAIKQTKPSQVFHETLPPPVLDLRTTIHGKHPELKQSFWEKLKMPPASETPLYSSTIAPRFKDLEEKHKSLAKNQRKLLEPLLPGKSLVARSLLIYNHAIVKSLFQGLLQSMSMLDEATFEQHPELEEQYQGLLEKLQSVTVNYEILASFQKSVLRTDNSTQEYDKALLTDFTKWSAENPLSKPNQLKTQIDMKFRAKTAALEDKANNPMSKYNFSLTTFCQKNGTAKNQNSNQKNSYAPGKGAY